MKKETLKQGGIFLIISAILLISCDIDNKGKNKVRDSIKSAKIIESDSLAWNLDEDENYVLSYLLTDPQSTNRGVWVYPVHQQLTYKGYKESQVTQIITSLEVKGLIQYANISSYDDLKKRESTAPVYKITEKGLAFIANNKSYLLQINDTDNKNRNESENFTKSAKIVENDSLTWNLDKDENYVLSYLLTDPQSTNRGVWVYPAHQQLTYRGYKESQITQIISSLKIKGLIQHINVLSYDNLEKRESTAPVYKITKKGLAFIANNKSHLLQINDTYRYTIRLYGDRQSNQKFLENIQDIDYVQDQTRFITEDDPKLSTIAVFAYRSLDKNAIFQLAKISDSKIYEFKEAN